MKGYKFTDKKQSKMGMISTIIGIIALVLICYAVHLSFLADGKGSEIIGVFGSIGMLLSIVGMILGLRSFKNDDVFYLFSWTGTIINILIVLFTGSMVLIGA